MNKENEQYGLKYINKLYRACLYPFTKINYVDYCLKYEGGDDINKIKLSHCLNGSCHLCCYSLQDIYLKQSLSLPLGKFFSFDKEEKHNIIKKVISPEIINECNKECDISYKIEE